MYHSPPPSPEILNWKTTSTPLPFSALKICGIFAKMAPTVARPLAGGAAAGAGFPFFSKAWSMSPRTALSWSYSLAPSIPAILAQLAETSSTAGGVLPAPRMTPGAVMTAARL
ncbi:MAG: hypothetical protein A4E73_02287 [Syntrophaceae bacterium PtaU1.Bin231]|nr:MAG: hypothetical protein A4E73_02287 [Syntrophaceae bacterium PtaU1.Bin231]